MLNVRTMTTCIKCLYYAPLTGRSYNLSKCLKLDKFINVARDTCKGDLYFPKTNDPREFKSINCIDSIDFKLDLKNLTK